MDALVTVTGGQRAPVAPPEAESHESMRGACIHPATLSQAAVSECDKG